MKSKIIVRQFVCLFVASVLFTACKQGKNNATLEETAYSKELKKYKHAIPIKEAGEMTMTYMNFKDSLAAKKDIGIFFPNYHTFNIKEIQNILNQDSVIGIRVYYALKNNKLIPILTGVKPSGADYYPKENINGALARTAYDMSQTCDSPTCVKETPISLGNKYNPAYLNKD